MIAERIHWEQTSFLALWSSELLGNSENESSLKLKKVFIIWLLIFAGFDRSFLLVTVWKSNVINIAYSVDEVI